MTEVSHANCTAVSEQLSLLTKYKGDTMEVLRSLKERKEMMLLFATHVHKVEVIEGHSEVTEWRKKMITISRSLRSRTLDLCESILVWRSNLWRPAPFTWHGNNVLLSIKKEAQELLSSTVGRKAAEVG
jgi:hypothetical protein